MEIKLELIRWSFGAGILAFFNPCGFAMLPAYVAYYLGNSEPTVQSKLRALLNGLILGAVVSAGFLTVFSILGVIISLLGGAIGKFFPWAGALIGLGLLFVGAKMLSGNVPIGIPLLERLAGKISQSQGNPHPGGLSFYYFYGITYALASCGCTLPIFMIVIGTALAGGALNGFAQFGAYALAMALMMIALSIIMVFSRELISRILPSLMRVMRWAGGLGVIAAGAYLIYYNLFYGGFIRF